jgi:hypothetical protein
MPHNSKSRGCILLPDVVASAHRSWMEQRMKGASSTTSYVTCAIRLTKKQLVE